jgi:chromosome segregation protein
MTIQSSSIHENFVFSSLSLYNFKMHRNTQLNLSEVPITIISGANGSGKTQLLEALILAIGHTPNRVSLSTFKELIGPFDNYCNIKLFLNNPRMSEQRVIHSSDPDIASIVNSDSFYSELEIKHDGKIKRYIGTGNKKRKEITRTQIKRTMKNIGIFEDTMLNFTEEGYLGTFADGSPHKKLDNLLLATGMKEIFTSYIDSRKRVEDKEREFSPLALQLEKEQNKLDKLKENYERLLKKKELIQRFDEVEKELYWFNAIESQKNLEEAKKELEKKEKELEEIKKTESETKKEVQTIKEILDKENEKIFDSKTKIREMSDNLNRFKGQKDEKNKQIQEISSNLLTLENKIREYKSINSSKGFEKKIALQDQINSIKKEQKNIEKRMNEISKEMEYLSKEEDSIKERINERSQLYGELTDYERILIKDVIVFKEKISKSKYKEEIVGPIFEVINILPEHHDYEKAIKTVIGKHLYSFIATSQKAYEDAKRIYDELFVLYKPNFIVGRVIFEKGSKSKYLTSYEFEDKPEGLIDHIVNLIEGPDAAKIYLRKFIRIMLAKPSLSAGLLTDYAKKLKSNILTSDGKSFFLSQEAFTRPPRIHNVMLGVELSKYQSIERIREQLNQLYSRVEDLNIQRGECIRTVSDFDRERRDLEEKLKPWEMNKDEIEREFLRFEDTRSDLEEQQKYELSNLERLNEKIDNLSRELISSEKEFEKIQENQNEKREKYDNLLQSLQEIQTKRVKNKHHINLLSLDIDELEGRYKELIEIAKEKGSKSETIRENKEEILVEYNKIKGQLEFLEITPELNQETISEQSKKVELLNEEVRENENHLKNLKDDLEKRILEWEGGLNNIVNHLNRMLNLLLKDTFQNISVKITNYNDERSAGLIIEAETKGDNRIYRQLSGGEKTLIAQAIILALHMINQSPIHAIDEFTQKLDKKNRALAFSMALATYNLAKENRTITPQFVLITPMLDDVELSDEFTHKVLIESKVEKGKMKT